jgi:hypothetical protein
MEQQAGLDDFKLLPAMRGSRRSQRFKQHDDSKSSLVRGSIKKKAKGFTSNEDQQDKAQAFYTMKWFHWSALI